MGTDRPVQFRNTTEAQTTTRLQFGQTNYDNVSGDPYEIVEHPTNPDLAIAVFPTWAMIVNQDGHELNTTRTSVTPTNPRTEAKA